MAVRSRLQKKGVKPPLVKRRKKNRDAVDVFDEYLNEYDIDDKQALVLWLAVKSGLPLRLLRIAIFLSHRASFDVWTEVPQTAISRVLRMDAANVSTALKELVARGIVHRQAGVLKPGGYRLVHRHLLEMGASDQD
jgi:DNA-binding MarR family transcriptional regulator